MTSPSKVLKNFDMTQLEYMAELRNIDTAEKTKKQLVADLSAHVSSLGLSVMLRILKVKKLREMAWICEWNDPKQPLNKMTIEKKIQETMEEMGPREFIQKLDNLLKRDILDALEVEIPSSRKEYTDTILQTTDEMGMEKFFSSFPTTKIKELVKHCGLKVDSDCLDTLLKALIDQESIKAPYEPPEGEQPSKTKPGIDENISVVDLFHYFFREDLVEFCKKQGLTNNGSKKELVERIRRFFDKKTLDKDWKKTEENKRKKSVDNDDINDKKHTKQETKSKKQKNK